LVVCNKIVSCETKNHPPALSSIIKNKACLRVVFGQALTAWLIARSRRSSFSRKCAPPLSAGPHQRQTDEERPNHHGQWDHPQVSQQTQIVTAFVAVIANFSANGDDETDNSTDPHVDLCHDHLHLSWFFNYIINKMLNAILIH